MTTDFRTPSIKAKRVCVALAVAGLVSFASGCTTSAGPDLSVATYGVTTPSNTNGLPGGLPAGDPNAPDQAPGVMVAGATVPSPLPNNTGPAQQGFAPGAAPPSAVLPQELAVATALNSSAGAIANSAEYVTDGVVQKVQQPQPLTPSDVQGQAPAPQAAEAPQQVAAVTPASTAVSTAPSIPDPVVTPKTARAEKQAKPTLLGNLFGNKPKPAQQIMTASPAENEAKVELASLESTDNQTAPQTESMTSLPGVNAKNLFALDPAGKDGGEDGYEEEPPVQVASATAAGLARLAPNGLLKQTDRVEVGCFKPELVSVLKKIEAHYGKKLVVTSGYRSPSGNRRAGGSRHSLHMQCAAADIQISGVGKWELAKYLRSMPGRGGVGTYCYTDSVHIDIGSERDWNWRCRRR